MGLETTPQLNDLIQQAITNALFQTATVRVAQVESYSSDPRPMVTVKPSPKIRLTPVNGSRSEFLESPLLRDVPVMRWEFGPFVIDAELEKGDNGLLIVSDRDADKWVDGNGGPFEPGTPFIHNLNSAFFLPMVRPTSKTAPARAGKRTLLISDRTGKNVSIKLDEATSTIDIDAVGTVNLTAVSINFDTPGVLLGPYEAFGINVAGLPTHIGTAPVAGGPVVWTPNPAAGVLGTSIK